MPEILVFIQQNYSAFKNAVFHNRLMTQIIQTLREQSNSVVLFAALGNENKVTICLCSWRCSWKAIEHLCLLIWWLGTDCYALQYWRFSSSDFELFLQIEGANNWCCGKQLKSLLTWWSFVFKCTEAKGKPCMSFIVFEEVPPESSNIKNTIQTINRLYSLLERKAEQSRTLFFTYF